MFFTKYKQWDKQARPPKFRSQRYFFTQEYSQNGISFYLSTSGKLKLVYGKTRKDWIEIDIPDAGYENVKTVKIMQDKTTKKFYACLTYEIKKAPLKESGPVLYFDPGCKTSLTGIKTTGEFFEYYLNALRKINQCTYKVIDNLKSRRDLKKSRTSQSYRRLSRISPSKRTFECEHCNFIFARDHHSCLNFVKRFETSAMAVGNPPEN